MRPDQEPLLVEGRSTPRLTETTPWGWPRSARGELGRISRQTLYTYLSYHRPERMVIAGIGVVMTNWWSQCSVTCGHGPWRFQGGLRQSVAQYTGGLDTLEKDMSNVSLGPRPCRSSATSSSASRVSVIIFKAFIPSVCSTLMMGEAAFPPESPGKGMYTRLYIRVPSDTIGCTAPQPTNRLQRFRYLLHHRRATQQLQELTQVLLRICCNYRDTTEEELQRAKTQLIEIHAVDEP